MFSFHGVRLSYSILLFSELVDVGAQDDDKERVEEVGKEPDINFLNV